MSVAHMPISEETLGLLFEAQLHISTAETALKVLSTRKRLTAIDFEITSKQVSAAQNLLKDLQREIESFQEHGC